MLSDSDIITLHRYYIWANKMRTHFDEILKEGLSGKIPDKQFEIEANLYMSYWYGGLYVVIEGWKQLVLSDGTIDLLLKSKNVALLKTYRNGVFHFNKKYYDNHFLDLISKGEKSVNWIRALNKEFGRYFLDWYHNNKEKNKIR